MSVRADIMETARVLETAARASTAARFVAPSPLGESARVYAELIPRLTGHPDAARALSGAEFRPFFLVNGLLLATSLPRAPLRELLETLALGLLEFADHFERLAVPGTPVDAAGRRQQERYFAYCLAELTERGMPLTGVFATMKGDALDQETALDVRGWIEEGPTAMLASPLVPAEERELWRAVFERGKEAWPALRARLLRAYDLPARAEGR